jgi:hypothetical protein
VVAVELVEVAQQPKLVVLVVVVEILVMLVEVELLVREMLEDQA